MRSRFIQLLKGEKTHYDILKVSKNTSLTQLKTAYYELVQRYHPDLDNSAEAPQKLGEIKEVYDVLRDQRQRKL